MTEIPQDQWSRLLASWSAEIQSTTDRLNYLVGKGQPGPSGSYREVLLRRLLRRVLPDRFRVSTGFIDRWRDQSSGQLDVIVWDAQEHIAHLEEGELAVLAPDAVGAVIEVKSTLTAERLEEAVRHVCPADVYAWRFEPIGRLRQQVDGIPFRGVFAFGDETSADGIAVRAFKFVSEYCRELFGAEAKRAMKDNGMGVNLIDSICVLDKVQIEKTNATIECEGGNKYSGPALVAFTNPNDSADLTVGRFCMYLQAQLTSWPGSKRAREALNTPLPTTNPGMCYFGALPERPIKVWAWGIELNPAHLFIPSPPLWTED